MKKVVIIDYKMGNLASVKKAFEKVGGEAIISNEIKIIESAQYIVLPGVGAFGDGMKNLISLELVSILRQKVIYDKIPFLGICLGMQLIAEIGHEFGHHQGLGFIKGEVLKINTTDNLRLPHVGWNDIIIKKNDPLLKDLPDFNFYFTHSYHLDCSDKTIITSICNYGREFVATIRKDNIFATQFHPEKSQVSGLKLLENFLFYH